MMPNAAFMQAQGALLGRLRDAGISTSTRTLLDLRAACERMIDQIDREIGSRDDASHTPS